MRLYSMLFSYSEKNKQGVTVDSMAPLNKTSNRMYKRRTNKTHIVKTNKEKSQDDMLQEDIQDRPQERQQGDSEEEEIIEEANITDNILDEYGKVLRNFLYNKIVMDFYRYKYKNFLIVIINRV